MLTINYVDKRQYIYKSRAELEQYNERFAPIETACAGDYIETNTGHFIPVLYRKEYGRNPKFTYQALVVYLGGKYYVPQGSTMRYKPYFDPYRFEQSIVPLKGWMKHAAELISRGVKIYDAIKETKPDNIKTMSYAIDMCMGDKQFIHYLFNETSGYMALKDQLAERGITEGTMADQIAGLILDPKAKSNLKLWALKTAVEVITDKPTGNTNVFAPTMVNVSSLPPRQGSVLDQLKALPSEYAEVEKKELPQYEIAQMEQDNPQHTEG